MRLRCYEGGAHNLAAAALVVGETGAPAHRPLEYSLTKSETYLLEIWCGHLVYMPQVLTQGSEMMALQGYAISNLRDVGCTESQLADIAGNALATKSQCVVERCVCQHHCITGIWHTDCLTA